MAEVQTSDENVKIHQSALDYQGLSFITTVGIHMNPL
jgi:hypothetical protein